MKKVQNIRKLIPYMFFLLFMIVVVACKQNYHIDEIFTYGLSNSTTGIGMDVKLAPYTYTPASEAYTDYMAAKAPLDFSHVWENQKADVHPPFYYCLIYMVSFLFKGSTSRWIAGSINILFMLLTLWAIRKLIDALGCSRTFKNIFTCFFIISSGILSTISFLECISC